MIRINLLGEKQPVSSVAIVWLGSFGLATAATVAAAFIYYASLSSEVSELSQQQASLQAEFNNLQSKTKTVRELEQKKQLLKDKLLLIARLKKSKIGPVRVMDDLNTSVPEKVWIRSVEEKSGNMKIQGRALSNQDVALFMRELDASSFYDKIELGESRQMYYSKQSGMVTPTIDFSQVKSNSFQKDRRATKEASDKLAGDADSKWTVRKSGDDDEKSKRKEIEQSFIKIQEFVINARVTYAGITPVAAVAEPVDKVTTTPSGKKS